MNSFKPIILLFTILATYQLSQAQITQTTGAVDVSFSAGGNSNTVSMPPKSLEGTYYLEDEWLAGKVFLSSGYELKEFLIKYDIEHLLIELKSLTEIKVVAAMNVDSFFVNDVRYTYPRKYINTEYVNFDPPKLGFMEVLAEGKVTLLSRVELGVQLGYYVPALDVGNKNDEIIKLEKFYLIMNDEARPLPKARKDFIPLFEKSTRPQLRNYMTTNKLRIRRRKDLIKVIEYYNSL